MLEKIFQRGACAFLVFCTLFCGFFCFPTPLSSKSLHYSEVASDIHSLHVESQVWLKGQEEPLVKIQKQGQNRHDLRKIFKRIGKISYEIEKPTRHGWTKRSKNRNRAFLPYDENRTGRDIPGFYLSASDIVTQGQHYIVAQAPLRHTVKDYFQALLHRRSHVIVTTAMPIENGEHKAHAYWEEDAFPVLLKDWKVEHSKKDDEVLGRANNHRLVRRRFFATHKETGEKRTLTQLHYENWPDNGVPDFKLFVKLLDEVDALDVDKHEPITIHCSAGVGRSGTFVAAHSLRKIVRQAKADGKKADELIINIPEAILILRLQRKSMVANPKQMQVVYKTVALEL